MKKTNNLYFPSFQPQGLHHIVFAFPQEGPHCLNLIDFDHLLRESQKEVLRLQRQIALKNFKESLHSSKAGSKSSSSIAANCLGPSVPTLDTSINFSSLSKGVQLGEPTLAMGAHRKVRYLGQ